MKNQGKSKNAQEAIFQWFETQSVGTAKFITGELAIDGQFQECMKH
ncbi:MAG: hypothetical protein ACXWFI_08000 [Methylobacter sp.]